MGEGGPLAGNESIQCGRERPHGYGLLLDAVPAVASVHRLSYPADDACGAAVAHADVSSPARPCDREKKGALFECFDVMGHAAIERQQTAGAKAEGPPRGPHPDVARQHVDRDSPFGFVFGDSRARPVSYTHLTL